METTKTSEDLNLHRRHFFGAAAMSIAAAQLGVIGSANAQRKQNCPRSSRRPIHRSDP
jgi:hypothetical protein